LQGLYEILERPRTAITAATATSGTGFATLLSWIPADIGKLASLIGIVLSILLIYIHIRKMRLDLRAGEIQIEILEHERRIAEARECTAIEETNK